LLFIRALGGKRPFEAIPARIGHEAHIDIKRAESPSLALSVQAPRLEDAALAFVL
jgi:hypothetical protein